MARKRKSSEDSQDPGSPELDSKGKPIQRNAANARERARMRVLSKAFSRLKTTLPWVPADTKLSKLDTLRLASCYIAHLQAILDDDKGENSNGSSSEHIHPINLTWPFTFNSKMANSLDSKSGLSPETLKLPTKPSADIPRQTEIQSNA